MCPVSDALYYLLDAEHHCEFVHAGLRGAEFLDREPKLGGRYQLEEFSCGHAAEQLVSVRERYYWRDGSYRRVFWVREPFEDVDAEAGQTVWDDEERVLYEQSLKAAEPP